MSAPVLRVVQSRHAVRERLADLGLRAMPRFEDVGRQADQTVDRLRGRPSRPSWLRPLLAVGILGAMVAIAGMAMSASRRASRRWNEEDALDQLDRISEPLSSSVDGRASRDLTGMAGLGSVGSAGFVGAAHAGPDMTGLDDQQAEVF
jgi:hypothetical protein